MFDIPHGRTNAILMPHVIRYNGRNPQKHAMFPKDDYFRADKDYADIARFMGWGTDKQSDAELVESLRIGCCRGYQHELERPRGYEETSSRHCLYFGRSCVRRPRYNLLIPKNLLFQN